MLIDQPRAQADIVGKFELGVEEAAIAFRRGQQIVFRREIIAIGRGEILEVGRIGRPAADRRDQRQVLVADHEAAVGRRTGAATDRVGAAGLARIGIARDGAVGGPHALLFHIIAAEDDRHPFRLDAIAGVEVIGFAIALFVGAELGGQIEPLLRLFGDDVDDAGNRVGAIERGGTRLQHFDPFDHAGGDGVQVDRCGDAAGGRSVHIAHAVDQDQGALSAQVTQVDFGRAGADAGAVGRTADIARIVDLGVEAAAGARNALQNIGDRGQAGACDRLLVDRDDRLVLVQRILADA